MAVKNASQRGRLFDSLNSLAAEIATTKAAAAGSRGKQADTHDPGGYNGPTTHPTKSVDNGTQPAIEGSRSAENTADIEENIGDISVDATEETTVGTQDRAQMNIGTRQSATGEDSSTEQDYKGTKDDPGTTHPADASAVGEKYSSVNYKVAQATATELANSILADLANGFGAKLASNNQPRQTARTVTAQSPLMKVANAAANSNQNNRQQSFQQGYELAAVLGIQKEAAEAGVRDMLASTIQDAQSDADLFGSYYLSFQERLQKQAMGDAAAEGESHAMPGEGMPMEGPPPEGGGGGGGGGSLGDLLGGGASPMGGEAPPGAGGAVGEEEALAELVAALEELGIPLEALAQASGGDGGGDPMMGGAPPMGGDPMAGMAPPPGNMPTEGAKLAYAIHQFKRSGRYQIKAASTQRQRGLRDAMKTYVQELMGYQS